MKVSVSNRQSALLIKTPAVRRLVKAVLDFENVEYDEVSVYLVDTDEISELHDIYFDDPSTTDTISFPMRDKDPEAYCMLGDVFVCPETAVTYAKTHKGDPYTETTLYIVHGLLHLLGYDDLEPKAKRIMRAAEKRCMTHLRQQGLILNSGRKTEARGQKRRGRQKTEVRK